MAKDNKIKDKELNKVSGGYIPEHGYERYEYDENCPKCKGANKVHVTILVQPGKRSTDKNFYLLTLTKLIFNLNILSKLF